ncbi:hypothetical protein PoB_006610200 [Plakobranchus ocellatus]|uniref:Secreted protein n=1 Tax=Plakobranchus ocellatus TaxID=259542 RepID=A0AAV4D624_9GAST|nr:hypothetical protein PoB_006610200 [Plakobranchus ocellatus]
MRMRRRRTRIITIIQVFMHVAGPLSGDLRLLDLVKPQTQVKCPKFQCEFIIYWASHAPHDDDNDDDDDDDDDYDDETCIDLIVHRYYE